MRSAETREFREILVNVFFQRATSLGGIGSKDARPSPFDVGDRFREHVLRDAAIGGGRTADATVPMVGEVDPVAIAALVDAASGER